MNELEIISWVLIALFILAITTAVVSWRFIRKYEKLKLEFTTSKLDEFGSMLRQFIDNGNSSINTFCSNASNQDQEFHKRRIAGYKDFLKKMEADYSEHTSKVKELNKKYSQLNKEMAKRDKEFTAINPQLLATNKLLEEEDLKIKELIEKLFEILMVTGKQFDQRFKELNEALVKETEYTHAKHRDKIKEYASELSLTMKQLEKNLCKSQDEVMLNYRKELLEHASEAELSLKKAVKDHSLAKLAEKIQTTNEIQLTITEKLDNYDLQLEMINTRHNKLAHLLNDIHSTINQSKDSKGFIKSFFK